jgi:hypothetical protein
MQNEHEEDAAPPRDPLIEAIREKVNAYIAGAPGHDDMSLREMSRRIGMSAAGLQKFAAGSMPYTATRRRLIRWFRALSSGSREEQKRDGLALLLRDVPDAHRGDAERRILEIVSELEVPREEERIVARRRPRRPRRRASGDPLN